MKAKNLMNRSLRLQRLRLGAMSAIFIHTFAGGDNSLIPSSGGPMFIGAMAGLGTSSGWDEEGTKL